MSVKVKYVLATLVIAFSMVVVLSVDDPTSLPTAKATDRDMVITVGGTGMLVESRGHYRLCTNPAGFECSVDLGIVDMETDITVFPGVMPEPRPIVSGFVGKRVTIMAVVDVKLDNERVFTAIRTQRLTILHGSQVLQ